MGAGAISGISRDQISEIARRTKFSEQQVKLLWKRFSALDISDRGYLTSVEFQFLPELIFNPIVDRILDVVRAKPPWPSLGDGGLSARRKSRALLGDNVDFVLFIRTLDVFHPDRVRRSRINETDFALYPKH
jgi:hypothetical protein